RVNEILNTTRRGRARPRGLTTSRTAHSLSVTAALSEYYPFSRPRLIAMLRSPAYRVLSLSAHRLLARIEIELHQHGGEDNGKLPVPYEQFVEYGIHRHAIAPAIRECEALGFLEAEHGQAGNREYRWPSVYRLTYRPVGRARPTDEWRRISTIEEAEAI